MQAPEFLIEVLDRLQHTLETAVNGLTEEDLAYRPDPKVNPIRFMVWHMSREEDYVISEFDEREQAWISGGWHERFGKPAEDTAFLPERPFTDIIRNGSGFRGSRRVEIH